MPKRRTSSSAARHCGSARAGVPCNVRRGGRSGPEQPREGDEIVEQRRPSIGGRSSRCAVAALSTLLACAALSGSAGAVTVKRTFMPSFKATSEEPSRLAKVGVIKVGHRMAKNVLVLEPGTSAGAGYFVPFAKSLVEAAPGWQV